MNYQEMPMRAYAVTFVEDAYDPDKLTEEIFQARSLAEAAEAAEAAEIWNLDGSSVGSSTSVEEAWQNYWNSTICRPRFLIGKIRDLGKVKNPPQLENHEILEIT